MPTKTKAELEAEIKDLKGQLDAKTKEEKFNDSAIEIYNMYKSFITAGFDAGQAWELTINIINNSTTKRSIF